jgi:8-oxo-dGTP pyrophosphatase MutT (NUDIX family)
VHLEVLAGDSAFKVRSAALIVRDGRVLLTCTRLGSAWMLPGGTGEFGETAEETLRRELREELRADANVGRLLWVVEHLFDLEGRRWHQLLRIHEAALPDDCEVVGQETWESPHDGGVDRFRWTPLRELRSLRVLPGFLADAAGEPPREPLRVLHRDYLA